MNILYFETNLEFMKDNAMVLQDTYTVQAYSDLDEMKQGVMNNSIPRACVIDIDNDRGIEAVDFAKKFYQDVPLITTCNGDCEKGTDYCQGKYIERTGESQICKLIQSNYHFIKPVSPEEITKVLKNLIGE